MAKNVIDSIKNIISSERVLVDEPMSEHTSFKIGGPADAMVIVENEGELAEVLKLVQVNEHILVGNGSNFLVADSGYPGIMIKLAGEFDEIKLIGDENICVGGAKLLSAVSTFATENGLSGIEFASGIPGSIGGAMFMNAGAYGGEMKDITESVRLMKPDGSEIFERNNSEMEFGYRHSRIQDDEAIVLSVKLKLEKGNVDEI